MMKNSRYFCVLVILFVIPAGNREEEESAAPTETESSTPEQQGDPIAIEDAVARVNGQLLGREEFDEVVESNIARYEVQSGQEFDEAQRPLLERQVLDGLITRTILEQETERLEIVDESAYQMALEQQGFTEEQFEAELRRQMVIEELIRSQVYDQVEVEDEAMRGAASTTPTRSTSSSRNRWRRGTSSLRPMTTRPRKSGRRFRPSSPGFARRS